MPTFKNSGTWQTKPKEICFAGKLCDLECEPYYDFNIRNITVTEWDPVNFFYGNNCAARKCRPGEEPGSAKPEPLTSYE